MATITLYGYNNIMKVCKTAITYFRSKIANFNSKDNGLAFPI